MLRSVTSNIALAHPRLLSVLASVVVGVGLWASLAGAASDSSRPTRVVGSPAVFRLTDYASQPSTTPYGDYRYTVVFKLNTDPQGRLSGGYSDVGRGNFYIWGNTTIVGHLYGAKQQTAKTANCFRGDVTSDEPAVQEHRRTPLGAKVPVSLHPYEVNANGDRVFGRIFRRAARLQAGDARLRSTQAGAALRRIGCA